MRELTNKEISIVNGGIGIGGAAVGAIGGASGYYGNSVSSGEGSFGGFAAATLGGAVSGFFLGPTANIGAWSVVTGAVSFYGGMVAGAIQTWADS